MRKLVQIKTITAIDPIANADAIERATIDDGWCVVVKRGEFSVGDECVYHEIDSFLPLDNPAYQFLAGRNERVFNGNVGVRLRTMKLRGCLSQGLALPISSVPKVQGVIDKCNKRGNDYKLLDLSFVLHVVKWEQPENAQLAGNAKGSFPYFIRKTDQERCQNIANDIFVKHKDTDYELTMKLDGSSMTGYYKDGVIGVCSRNLELKLDGNESNSFVKMFDVSGLANALVSLGRNIAVQGELMGPGIQGNREGFTQHEFFVFDIWDIDKQRYLLPTERNFVIGNLNVAGFIGKQVPVISPCTKLPAVNMDGLLEFANGVSINNPIREGLVYKSMSCDFTFKTISNRFLLKGGE